MNVLITIRSPYGEANRQLGYFIGNARSEDELRYRRPRGLFKRLLDAACNPDRPRGVRRRRPAHARIVPLKIGVAGRLGAARREAVIATTSARQERPEDERKPAALWKCASLPRFIYRALYLPKGWVDDHRLA